MCVQMSNVELLSVCTVLQECIDQLSILGHIMPNSYKGRPEADMVLSVDIKAVMEQQRAAELNLKVARRGQVGKSQLTEATQELHRTQKELNCTLEENPMSPDTLAKVERDRQFLAQVLTEVLAELQEKGMFHSLLLAVEEEKKKKAQLLDIIQREEESRLRIKALQKQLLDIGKKKTVDLQKRDEMTAFLKDQSQEVKLHTALERKYVQSSAEVLVYQGRKRNSQKEREMEEEIKHLQDALEEERRVHAEMTSFLKKQQTILGEKLEVWMERYERDMEDKQQELSNMRNTKAINLLQLQELAKKYRESEQVIIEDRVRKEDLRKQMEREQLEMDAATMIQSWWRGTMVRKGLGPYKKSKKPKAKEGKKGKKKKK
ncbi:dynein regulatory complex protein 9 [Chanos chanos]|uniref:Dynein regulatory complex protein 9 n=1 Tax=Chanos chanos TaxID=29144 RepID=A0A6J2UQU2_CHACN|nr:dynein regulatory complex protein 9 [Chanos chanos]